MRSPWSFALASLAIIGTGLTLRARPEPPTPTLIERPNAFPTLVSPNCSHCLDEAKRRAHELRADDRVLCWTRGKYEGGAIPMRFFLAAHRVISDTYGVFVYDPDAGYARGFAPSVDFRFDGWRNGVMVMRHKDGTLYSCLTGVAFAGPRRGDHLRSFPTLVTEWGAWLKQYPGTVAYHMYDKYRPMELPTGLNPDSLRSRGPADRRLPIDAVVLGVSDGTHALAWPIDSGPKSQAPTATAFSFAGRPCVVLSDDSTHTVSAYAQVAERHAAAKNLGEEGQLLATQAVEIQADSGSPAAPFVDRRTGSRFDLTGRCTAGTLRRWTLGPLDAVVVKWFAWVAEHPDTAIQGK